LCKVEGKQKEFYAKKSSMLLMLLKVWVKSTPMSNIVGNNSNVESMAICNVVAIKVVQLVAIKVQATL